MVIREEKELGMKQKRDGEGDEGWERAVVNTRGQEWEEGRGVVAKGERHAGWRYRQ